MKSEAKKNSQIRMPYIYEQFKVLPFYQKSSGTADGTLHNMFNSVVEALNQETYLPAYIILIPDRDLILQLDDFLQPRISLVLEEGLAWLVKQLDRAILGRKEFLVKQCPGAVPLDTKLIWIEMINRPFIKHHTFPVYNLVVDLRSIFNRTLQQEIKCSKLSLLISPTDDTEIRGYFDHFGNLTHEGKENFWTSVDSKLKCYDTGHGARNYLKPWMKLGNINSSDNPTTSTTTRDRMNDDIWGEAGRQSKLIHKNSC